MQQLKDSRPDQEGVMEAIMAVGSEALKQIPVPLVIANPCAAHEDFRSTLQCTYGLFLCTLYRVLLSAGSATRQVHGDIFSSRLPSTSGNSPLTSNMLGMS